MDWRIAKQEIEKARKAIWFDMPDEAKKIQRGENECGTNVYGQYFTVLVFAEGEMRTTSDEFLWGMRQVALNEESCLKTIIMLAHQFFNYKQEMFDFCGLYQSAAIMRTFLEGIDSVANHQEFIEYVDEMLLYINRAHMWVDMVFPWGLGMGLAKNRFC